MKPQSDILILSLDTATAARSIVVTRGAEVLSRIDDAPATPDARRGLTPSNVLLSDIDAALRAAQVDLKEIDVFAAAQGPGSFMGLRAGLATIKAFAVASEKIAVGIPTLEAIARAGFWAMKKRADFGSVKRAAFIAYMPAGRGEFFAQMSKYDAENLLEDDLQAITSPAYLAPSVLISESEKYEQVVWIGCGEKSRLIDFTDERMATLSTRGVARVETESVAEHIAALAWKKWRCELSSIDATERMRRIEELQAMYVRPSDAEIKSPKFRVPSSK